MGWLGCLALQGCVLVALTRSSLTVTPTNGADGTDVSATVGRLSPRADLDGETYEQWVTGYAINSGKGQGKAAQRRQAVRVLAPDVSSARACVSGANFSSTGPKARDRVGDRIFHASVHHPSSQLIH